MEAAARFFRCCLRRSGLYPLSLRPLDLFFNNYEELWFHFQDIIGGVAVIA